MWDITSESFQANPEAVLSRIKENWNTIPLLSSSTVFTEGSLVRFIGMVQNIPNPVFYLKSYEVENETTKVKSIRSGKFKETLDLTNEEQILFESEKTENGEKIPYYCINIPGLNDWAKVSDAKIQKDKRSADEMEIDQEYKLFSIKFNPYTTFSDTKRQRTESGSRIVALTNNYLAGKTYPIPGPCNHACIIYLYDTNDVYKVTDTIEAVGFVHRNATHEESLNVPNIHAIFHKRTSTLFTNQEAEIYAQAKSIRSELNFLLAQLFFGDYLTADYFICFLLSKIYHRTESETLGKNCFNICNIPDVNGYPTLIYNVLSRLVPKSHHFEMTLNSMNNFDFFPVKNIEENILNSGMLQLAPSTYVVIDETKLEEGQLKDKGVRNMAALNNVIKRQKIAYDFKYFHIDYDTDLPILVLSKGKSILPTDCTVVLKPETVENLDVISKAISAYLNENLVSKFRAYLNIMSHQDFEMKDNISEFIQNSLVNVRRTFNASPDELHFLLVLARMMSLSYGEKTLTENVWKRVLEMDTERRNRFDSWRQ